MARFGRRALPGDVRRANCDAHVGEHIHAGYHADAGAREAPSASTRRFPGTGVGVVPSADVFIDARAADSAPHLPRARTAPKRAILDPGDPSYKKKSPRTPTSGGIDN